MNKADEPRETEAVDGFNDLDADGTDYSSQELIDAAVSGLLLQSEEMAMDVTVNPATFSNLKPSAHTNGSSTSLDMLLDIGLQVTVELGRAKMTIAEVLSLGPGTVVELNRVAGEPVDILINGKAIAKGEVVVIGDMFGVRVTDIIPPAARVQSMV